GVRLREMITARDGAPNFSLRVFDLEAGASTPFHAHPWEHEVFILTGTGTVRTEGRKTSFRAGACLYLAPQEAHCFVADPGTPIQFICVIPVKDQCGM
ncbi:MAG: cupin domain-containing protein, partial [Nitrospirales bacterium]